MTVLLQLPLDRFAGRTEPYARGGGDREPAPGRRRPDRFYQVLARFVLFRSAAWSEPLIQNALIWMTHLALAEAMR